jgi:DNA polymerase IV
MVKPTDGLSFNSTPSTIMHIDLNSCFASVEQQANPTLRGRPIAVAAYTSPNGCILAASVEAKKLGIATGLRVREGKSLCPDLIILPPDPPKYRFIHLQLRKLLSCYSSDIVPKSIDEFILDFKNYPGFTNGLISTGREIKAKIKRHVGDWLTVSVGIGPNRFLAKQASNLKKPDGLEEINYLNFKEIYSNLALPDIHGINSRLTARLCASGIYTVTDFYNADVPKLKSVFHSINSYYWYLRLRGWEIDAVDFSRKSFGNMYSLPKHFTSIADLSPILHKLVAKMTFRLRSSGYQARGIYLGVLYTDHSFWHHHRLVRHYLFDSADIYRNIFRLLLSSPHLKPVANLAVSCFDLIKDNSVQLDLFHRISRSLSLSAAADSINRKYGHFVISPASMIHTGSLIPDRIGFGNIGDLTEFITS